MIREIDYKIGKAFKYIHDFVKMSLCIIALLTGNELARQILLHIHFGSGLLTDIQAQILLIGTKMMQLLFIMMVLRYSGFMKYLKFDARNYIKGMKAASWLWAIYALLLVGGVIHITGIVPGFGITQPVSLRLIALKIIYYVAGVAVTEEILFRVIIIKILSKTIGNHGKKKKMWIIILQALIFSSLHALKYIKYSMYQTAIESMICSFIGGIIYGIIYMKSKSVWATVSLHGWYDVSMWMLCLDNFAN